LNGNGVDLEIENQRLSSNLVRELAAECGLHLAGVATTGPAPDFGRFAEWAKRGLAGEMRYLTDHRAALRSDAATLLPGVRSVICAGMVYNGPEPYSTEFSDAERGWIARYAWTEDYHTILRQKLEHLADKIQERWTFAYRICVDTAPLLERSWAREAGLGWIGKNTCLISQEAGSFFLIGEILTTLAAEPGSPPPDRCGTCTRCIDSCPTQAIVLSSEGRFELDARRCISYFTIELRGEIPEEHRAASGRHIFGCDICQDVCPWNRKAPRPAPPADPVMVAPPLARMAALSEDEFRALFRKTPVNRAKYRGFLRNVALAMGNSGNPDFRSPLERLALHEDPIVAEQARWSLQRI
jgi:epoxyqueuosine reductase